MIYFHTIGKENLARFSNITKAPFPCESAADIPTDDPTKLLPELLDSLITIGDMAQHLSQALGRNGHRPDEIQKLLQEISNDK